MMKTKTNWTATLVTAGFLIFLFILFYNSSTLISNYVPAEKFAFWNEAKADTVVSGEGFEYMWNWSTNKLDQATTEAQNVANIGIGWTIKNIVVLICYLFWLPMFLAFGLPLILPARGPWAERSRLILLTSGIISSAILWWLFKADLSQLWSHAISFNFDEMNNLSLTWKLHALSITSFISLMMVYRFAKQYLGNVIDLLVWAGTFLYSISLGLIVPIDLFGLTIMLMNILLYTSLTVEQMKGFVWDGGISYIFKRTPKSQPV